MVINKIEIVVSVVFMFSWFLSLINEKYFICCLVRVC